jgi:hypothetical protein
MLLTNFGGQTKFSRQRPNNIKIFGKVKMIWFIEAVTKRKDDEKTTRCVHLTLFSLSHLHNPGIIPNSVGIVPVSWLSSSRKTSVIKRQAMKVSHHFLSDRSPVGKNPDSYLLKRFFKKSMPSCPRRRLSLA